MKKTIIFVLLLIMAIPTFSYGLSNNTVTLLEYTYSYYEDGVTPEYNMHGVFESSLGNPVYCGNHALPAPVGNEIGGSKSFVMHEYNNDLVKKILYYGYLGPKEWKGFSDPNYNSVYKASTNEGKRKWCGNAITGIALTKTQEKGYFYDVSGFNAFWAYISNAPLPPDGFKTYIMYGNNDEQDLFTWTYYPKGELLIKKEALDNGHLVLECGEQYSLEGAEYTISRNSSGTEVVCTMTTKKDGSTDKITLDTGTYFVRETRPPKGFKRDQKQYTVTIEDGKVNTFIVKDEPMFDSLSLLLEKRDAESGEGLQGATFKVNYYKEILDDTSKTIPERTWFFKTDSQGKIYLKEEYKVGGDLLYNDSEGNPIGLIGTYEFTEIEAPKGYVKTNEKILRRIMRDDKEENVLTTYNVPTIDNIPQKISIIIQKYDAYCGDDTLTQTNLSGAIFEVRDNEDNLIASVVTDTHGKATITDLYPGKYKIREIKAPDGYQINTEEIVLDALPYDDAIITSEYYINVKENPTVTNILKYTMSEGQKIPLEGAHLQIIDSNGNVVNEFVSTKERKVIRYLPVGKYTLRETKAPFGYENSADISFEIRDGEEITCVEMANKPIVVKAKEPFNPIPKTGNENPLLAYITVIILSMVITISTKKA